MLTLARLNCSKYFLQKIILVTQKEKTTKNKKL